MRDWHYCIPNLHNVKKQHVKRIYNRCLHCIMHAFVLILPKQAHWFSDMRYQDVISLHFSMFQCFILISAYFTSGEQMLLQTLYWQISIHDRNQQIYKLGLSQKRYKSDSAAKDTTTLYKERVRKLEVLQSRARRDVWCFLTLTLAFSTDSPRLKGFCAACFSSSSSWWTAAHFNSYMLHSVTKPSFEVSYV